MKSLKMTWDLAHTWELRGSKSNGGTATKAATKATDEALSTAKAATEIAATQTNAALSLIDAGNALEYAATTTAQAVDEALELLV